MDLNKTYFRKRRKGLTLVEMLVAMTILSVVIAITLSVLFTVQKTYKSIEKKYDCNAEAGRIAQDMEHALRLARQLIAATYNQVVFLDINAETIEYYQKNDTLFKNNQSVTNLAVDSLLFIYAKFKDDEKISDFHVIDLDNNGMLDAYELDGVAGINVHLWLSSFSKQNSSRIRVEKQFFVQLRNLSY
jgi:prepilin-type N-terminal cleavage/methylation domain-containing protein